MPQCGHACLASAQRLLALSKAEILVLRFVPRQFGIFCCVPSFDLGVVIEGHDELGKLLVPVRRERRVDGAGLRRSRVGRYAIAAIARIETLNHTCCCASMSFQRVGIVSKCAYAPRPSSSRGGLLADCPPPQGLLARAMPPVVHEAAITASHSGIALQQCAVCSVRSAE